MKKAILLILSVVLFSFLYSQTDDVQKPPPLTTPWEIVEVGEHPGVVPYPLVKQENVMWHVTIWRQIDLREKRNHALYFPTEPQGIYRSLGQVILDAIDMNNPDNENALPLYENEFCQEKKDRNEVKNVLNNSKTILAIDPDTGEPTGGNITFDVPFTAAQIMYYRLKEVWFFDKNRGELNVRIIEIEPFFEIERDEIALTEDGDNLSKRRLGYIKYDELRPFLAQQQYYTPQNSALQVTFDDVLTWKRYFSSFIIAEGNIQNNREIQDYITNPRDQRLKSEEIMTRIRNFESELWEY